MATLLVAQQRGKPAGEVSFINRRVVRVDKKYVAEATCEVE